MNSATGHRDRAAVVSTGRWIAAARAQESTRPDRLFDDPWASALAGEAGKAALATAPYNPFLPVRTRYFDDLILASATDCPQVVLLGAGLDTRAFRLPLPATSVLYEVDYPEAFDGKDSVLGRSPAACGRRTVAADLAGPWFPSLRAAGFDPALRTIWVAEGLFYYLTAAAAEALIRSTAEASSPGSSLIADVFGTGLLDLASMAPLVSARRKAGRELPFCTDAPAELFRHGGWEKCRIVSPGQAAAKFGRLAPVPDDAGPGSNTTLRTHLVRATL
ncbi:class I SAM-dependent methyltransferase [Arthrobacter sp. NPDC057259]|uniref:class I SAM-dependent methyltransferase n=1 Tax=Arthrobacter sp. NPDC057259 TaxID=3346073 RepID=UPI00363B3BB0